MPKYKLSPEERAAEKEKRENMQKLLAGLDIKDFNDIQELFKDMVGSSIGKWFRGRTG